LENQLLHDVRSDTCCEELTVTTNRISAVENNEAIVKNRKSGLELSSYGPTDLEFAEFFGSGSEYLPFWRRPASPFSLVHLFEQEDE